MVVNIMYLNFGQRPTRTIFDYGLRPTRAMLVDGLCPAEVKRWTRKET